MEPTILVGSYLTGPTTFVGSIEIRIRGLGQPRPHAIQGLDALKAKITDPVVRKWADTLKVKSRTKLFIFLQFWDWASEVFAKDPQTGEEKVRYWKSLMR
jgi:hypothetical protein